MCLVSSMVVSRFSFIIVLLLLPNIQLTVRMTLRQRDSMVPGVLML